MIRPSRILLAALLLLALPAAARPRLVAAPFLRGDGNLDGRVDLADPVALLLHLFAGHPSPKCPDAADADDDGSLSISDALRSLDHLFRGGPPLPPPYPSPGVDPTADALPCDVAGAPPGVGLDDLSIPAPPSILESTSGDVVVLPPEVFEALGDLPRAGTHLWEVEERLQEVTGGAFSLEDWLGALPRAGSPAAIGAVLTVPVADAAGCWRVVPEWLDGGSTVAAIPFIRGDLDGDTRVDEADLEVLGDCLAAPEESAESCGGDCPPAWDFNDDGRIDLADLDTLAAALLGEEVPLAAPLERCGPDPSPDALGPCLSSSCDGAREDLQFDAKPREICGPGPHPVTLLVTDREGRQSRAPALVTLCDGRTGPCPLVPTRQETGPRQEARPGNVTCRWLATVLVHPAGASRELYQKAYGPRGEIDVIRDGPPFKGLSPSLFAARIEGAGPTHHLFVTRRKATCTTPPGSLERLAGGLIELRANLLCANGDGVIVPPPCHVRLEAESLYQSEAEIESREGRHCGGRPARVESLARDESRFLANGSVVFAKGVTVQNGTQITSSPSYALAMEQRVGPGISASWQAGFGITHGVVHGTGAARGRLNAFSGTAPPVPATLTLEAQGQVRIHGERRSASRARVTSQAAAVWLAGISTCPGAGHVASQVIIGHAPGVSLALARARQFFRTRLGRDIGGENR